MVGTNLFRPNSSRPTSSHPVVTSATRTAELISIEDVVQPDSARVRSARPALRGLVLPPSTVATPPLSRSNQTA